MHLCGAMRRRLNLRLIQETNRNVTFSFLYCLWSTVAFLLASCCTFAWIVQKHLTGKFRNLTPTLCGTIFSISVSRTRYILLTNTHVYTYTLWTTGSSSVWCGFMVYMPLYLYRRICSAFLIPDFLASYTLHTLYRCGHRYINTAGTGIQFGRDPVSGLLVWDSSALAWTQLVSLPTLSLRYFITTVLDMMCSMSTYIWKSSQPINNSVFCALKQNWHDKLHLIH